MEGAWIYERSPRFRRLDAPQRFCSGWTRENTAHSLATVNGRTTVAFPGGRAGHGVSWTCRDPPVLSYLPAEFPRRPRKNLLFPDCQAMSQLCNGRRRPEFFARYTPKLARVLVNALSLSDSLSLSLSSYLLRLSTVCLMTL